MSEINLIEILSIPGHSHNVLFLYFFSRNQNLQELKLAKKCKHFKCFMIVNKFTNIFTKCVWKIIKDQRNISLLKIDDKLLIVIIYITYFN